MTDGNSSLLSHNDQLTVKFSNIKLNHIAMREVKGPLYHKTGSQKYYVYLLSQMNECAS